MPEQQDSLIATSMEQLIEEGPEESPWSLFKNSGSERGGGS